MSSFRDLIYPPITLAGFQALRAKQPKRICFGSTHRTALKSPNAKGAGFLNVPFRETISELFPWELRENTKFGGYFYKIRDAREFSEIELWIQERQDLVFLRSLFNTAVATCEHYVSSEQRSEVGALEYSAKYEGNIESRDRLVIVVLDAFQRIYRHSRIDAVLSVPSSKVGQQSLPNYISQNMALQLGIPDLTASLNWNGVKGQVKELGVDDKWNALEAVGMNVGPEIFRKNLLLIDDMYQSGATAHFVASKLRAGGANQMHLLAVSKGRRDTDNT